MNCLKTLCNFFEILVAANIKVPFERFKHGAPHRSSQNVDETQELQEDNSLPEECWEFPCESLHDIYEDVVTLFLLVLEDNFHRFDDKVGLSQEDFAETFRAGEDELLLAELLHLQESDEQPVFLLAVNLDTELVFHALLLSDPLVGF